MKSFTELFRVPGGQFNPLRLKYDQGVPTHTNKKSNHFQLCDATVVTPQPISAFKCIERYRNHLDAAGFCGMQNDGNELQVWKCLVERHDPAVMG